MVNDLYARLASLTADNDIHDVIASIQSNGSKGYDSVAMALNIRGVDCPFGEEWTPRLVRRVANLAEIKVTKSNRKKKRIKRRALHDGRMMDEVQFDSFEEDERYNGLDPVLAAALWEARDDEGDLGPAAVDFGVGASDHQARDHQALGQEEWVRGRDPHPPPGATAAQRRADREPMPGPAPRLTAQAKNDLKRGLTQRDADAVLAVCRLLLEMVGHGGALDRAAGAAAGGVRAAVSDATWAAAMRDIRSALGIDPEFSDSEMLDQARRSDDRTYGVVARIMNRHKIPNDQWWPGEGGGRAAPMAAPVSGTASASRAATSQNWASHLDFMDAQDVPLNPIIVC